MGLSASQARLLSITARISDNELHSQQIANAKVRLADQSQEASREYVNALDTQKLVYTMYDAKGNSTQVNLTPAVMYDFSELKNQYGISNNAGQLLVASTDAKHFENSSNLLDFLHSYDVRMKHNDEYDNLLQIIYSERPDLYDISNPNQYINLTYTFDYYGQKFKNLSNLTTTLNSSSTSQDYQNYANEYKNLIQGTQNNILWYEKGMQGLDFFGGTETEETLYNIYNDITSEQPEYTYGAAFTSYVNSLYNPPKFTTQCPDYATMCPTEEPDLFAYVQTLLAPACWTDTHIQQLRNGTQTTLSDNEIWHVEHVLAQYLWDGQNSDGSADTINIKGETITNGYYSADGTEKYWGITHGGAKYTSLLSEVDTKNVQGVINKSENSQLKKDLQELYYQVLTKIEDTWGIYDSTSNRSNYALMDGRITHNGSIQTLSNQEIAEKYLSLMNQLVLTVATDIINAGPSDPRYTEDLASYENQLKQYQQEQQDYKDAVIAYADEVNSYITGLKSWVKSVEYYQKNYKNLLDNVPKPEIIDETDPKVAWYTNLWHRMNGASDQKSVEGESGRYWKVLEDANLKSAAWLKYNLEQGIVTLEQVQKVDTAATETGLTSTKWQSKIFTTCTDIQFVDDETAVARAEAIYTKKLNEIEAKDKKYDNDIKKLDTEHNALQTEYESVKSVVDKNIERSFKAFS